MSTPHVWRTETTASGLCLLGLSTEDERCDVLPLNDIDLAEFERRYIERSHGSVASFERFRRIWEGETCRRSLVPRARIAATEEEFFSESPRGLFRLAVVWTLGEESDFERLAEGDALIELLLDMGSTLLLFEMWRNLLAYASNRMRSAGLYPVRTLQPGDAETIRRLFALPGVRDMEGVFLNSGGVMVPAKSRCAVVALGDIPTELPPPSPCSFCERGNCIYGQMGMCPNFPVA